MDDSILWLFYYSTCCFKGLSNPNQTRQQGTRVSFYPADLKANTFDSVPFLGRNTLGLIFPPAVVKWGSASVLALRLSGIGTCSF